jgi:hypothetical protein
LTGLIWWFAWIYGTRVLHSREPGKKSSRIVQGIFESDGILGYRQQPVHSSIESE